MIDKVLKTIKENCMFNEGDKVIVATSGGPDSICLLKLLYDLKEELKIDLVAAHVNHCLRGEESDKDEIYVKEFCEKYGLELYIKRVDIHKLSEERGISCESAGREARYEFFYKILKRINAQKIALAHNANDQSETVLMRIMRGTGIGGLTGIRPVRDKIYVRPIINITREEIEVYCEEKKLRPRIDKSNLENIYARNKVRLELIPYIKENFNKDIISTLNRLADTVSKDNEYLEEVSKEKYKTYCEEKENRFIIYKEAFLEHEAIITRIIRNSILNLKGNLYNLEKIHIYDIINLQKNNTGKKIELKDDIIAFNNYGDIHLYKELSSGNIENKKEYTLNINEENILKDLDIKVNLKVISKEDKINLKESDFIKYLDYNKVKKDITLRFRKEGDRFTPFGMNGNKKLKDLFIDLKVPKEERNRIPLICFDEEIAWVVGYRISEKFKIDKDTNEIVMIKIEKET